MEKTVRIQSIPREGYNFHGEAHRLWSAHEAVTVTVLPGEEDPPGVEVEFKNGSGEVVKEIRPNPTVIGQRSYRALQANKHIRILSDQDSIDTASLAEIKAAKEVAQKLSGELSDAKVEIAKRDEIIAQLKVQISTLEGKFAAAEAPKKPTAKAHEKAASPA